MSESGIEPAPSGGGGGKKAVKWLGGLALAALGVAILLPDFLEVRVSRGERLALRSARAIKASQEAYRRELGSFAPTIDCLVHPGGCVPTYLGGAFLDEAYAAERRDGYVFQLVGGPRDPAKATESYALFANPQRPGTTGVRSFCSDSAGRFCFDRKEMSPTSDSAACPATCEPLT